MSNELLQPCLDQWGLSLVKKIHEKKQTSVYFVQSIKAHEIFVLKTFSPDSDERDTDQVLSIYNGQGAVRVIKSVPQAILLERVFPGYDLSSEIVNAQNDGTNKIFCDVLRQLHSVPVPQKHSFDNVDVLVKEFDKYLHSGHDIFTHDEISFARQMYTQLCKNQKNLVLVHGDLHHYNILQDDKRGWVAIDPKGFIAEREYDVAAFLRNPIEYPKLYCDEVVFLSRLNMIAGELGLNRAKMLHWTYVQTFLAILYGVQEKSYLDGWLSFLKMVRRQTV